MQTIKLLSWHEDIKMKAAALRRRGLSVDASPLLKTSSVVGELARLSPAVLVLDLDRLPSHSREIALALRASRSACHIPILFAGGVSEKIGHIREQIPGATFTTWSEAPKAVDALLLRPPSKPSFVPPREFSTTPLLKKLGISSNMQVALVAAPDGVEEILGDLPEGSTLTRTIHPRSSVALCFIRSLDDLAATLDMLHLRLPAKASVWIVHPKRSGKLKVDFNQNHVRDHALAAGFVDYKVCSIDNDWSALKFAHRKR